MAAFAAARDLFTTLWRWYNDYLLDPAPNSFVVRLASTFRVLALIVIIPVFALTSLDISSYLIVRTLGATHTLRAGGAASELAGDPVVLEKESRKQTLLQLPDPSQFLRVSSGGAYPTTPTDDPVFALSGAGVFSPPASRSSSPPIHRQQQRSRAASLLGTGYAMTPTSAGSSSSIIFTHDGTESSVDGESSDSNSVVKVRRRRKRSSTKGSTIT